jgi:adhesin/invasin
MPRSVLRTGLLRVLALTSSIVLVTCTEDRQPLAPPTVGAPRFAAAPFSGPSVFVGAGDIATCVNNNDEATAQLLDGIPGTVFTAGDNAYPNGRAIDYLNCYDPTWGRHKARTWATLGNHEYDSSATADPSFDYFGDRAGPRGLGYYSFDLGAWHIVVLNDNGQFVPFTANTAQDQWFQADLAAHPNLCTLVMWHQPYVFSNKTATGSTTSPARKIFWDRAYAAGVDVVVNGHAHQYERFLPMTPDLVVDQDRGVRAFIIGTGGESTAQPVNIAPNSVVQAGTFGVMKFTLKDGGYDWQFFPIPGQTFTDAGNASCHDAAGGVSGSLSTVTASPTTIMKGGPTSTITVTAKDANGNPVSGAYVSLAASETGNTITQPANYTDANGVATGTLSSTVTGVKTVSATVNGIAAAQTAAVVVTAPASASRSKVTIAEKYVAVGTGTANITVTVLDAGSRPIAGATVTLQSTGSGNTLTQPTALTNANGVTNGTLSSTVAETKTISATANGTLLSQTASVEVTTPSASKSQLGASPTSFTAGAGSSTITVTVKEAGNHGLAGVAVQLSATGNGNTITQPVALTNANGVATGTLTSTVAGQKVVSATASGTAITKTATVTVNANPVSASLSTVAAAPTSIPLATGTSTITVTVKNGSGQPVSGATVVLAATGTGNTLVQPASVTNASGVATGTLSSTVAEAKTVSATADGIALTPTATVTVTPGGVSAGQSTLGASPSSIAAGSGTSTITVTAKDAAGNPMSGATVVLAATGTGNTLVQPASVTNASGLATGTLSSTVAETKTVSATINGLAITQTATVTVTSQSVSATLSTVVAEPTTIAPPAYCPTPVTSENVVNTVNASCPPMSSTITVTAKDVSGNPISGATVVLAASGSGNTLNQPVGLTDASGVAQGDLSSTIVGTKTITATVNGVALTQTAVVTVTAGAVSAAQSTVGAAPATIQAGNGTSTITVTAKDDRGNPINGATVVLAATGTGNTLVQPASVTNASGVATGTLSSSVAESKTVSATIDGTAITQTAVVTVTAASISASLSTVGAAPATFTAGSGSATITVTVLNSTGQPVSGANVVLASTGTQNTLVQPSAPTDANGVATGTLSSNKAELKSISATADGVAITQTAAVTVTAGPVSGTTTTVTSAPTSIAPGTETSTLRVTAKDALGNPVSGATVVLAATGSGNTLTQPATLTNSIGVASGTLSSTVAETKTVSATVNGVAITQTATVTVTAPGGGAITHTLLTSGNDVNNVKIFTTASISPAPNTLVTVAVTTHNATAAAPAPTLTGGGMASWDVVATVTYDAVGAPKKRITIFRAMSPAPGSGPITITSSITLSNCQWIVSQWSGVETSGSNGSGAIVQTGTNAADAVTTLATPLAPFGNSANVAYGVFGVNSNVVAITPGAGFTEIDEQPSTESTAADLFAEWGVNLPTINATWTTKNAGALGVEIKAQ